MNLVLLILPGSEIIMDIAVMAAHPRRRDGLLHWHRSIALVRRIDGANGPGGGALCRLANSKLQQFLDVLRRYLRGLAYLLLGDL